MMSWGQDWHLPSVILLTAQQPHPQLSVAWPCSTELAVTLSVQSELWQHFGFVQCCWYQAPKIVYGQLGLCENGHSLGHSQKLLLLLVLTKSLPAVLTGSRHLTG